MKTRDWARIVLVTGPLTVAACSATEASSGNSETTAESVAACTAVPSRSLAASTEFFAPPPSKVAREQVTDLLRSGRFFASAKLAMMQRIPHAVWFTGGSPEEVEDAVRKTMNHAARQRQVPVLVAYNLPYRDCSQYSAGGAADTAAYKAWIDGFAKGIGRGKAVVILEPDGLLIIPNNKTIYGSEEWCKPTVKDALGAAVQAPGANPEQRYAQLNYAVDSIESHAVQAALYLDASHSAALGVGEAAYRLNRAGVSRAQGFFLNVSNYQLTSDSIQFGTWVSSALAAAAAGPSWAFDENGNFHFDWLPSQYDPATNYASVNYSAEFVASVNAGLADFMNGAPATTHFVIDTSRNGQGPMDPTKYAAEPYSQPLSVIASLKSGDWCNPPGAGLGMRPTARTGTALLDAILWVKVPGESDGSCDSAGGVRAWDYSQYNPWNVATDAQSNFDPLWGMVDPAAGIWFPEQALELAQKANPPLL